MSRQRPDDSDRHDPSAPRSPPHAGFRSFREDPPITVQAGFVVAVVAGVVVLSYPAAAAAAMTAVVAVGLVVTAAGRAVRRAADREATVRVPVAGVEVTVARSGE